MDRAALVSLRNWMIGFLLSCLTGLNIPAPNPHVRVTKWNVREWSVSYFPGTMERDEGYLVWYVTIRLGKTEFRIWPDQDDDKKVSIF